MGEDKINTFKKAAFFYSGNLKFKNVIFAIKVSLIAKKIKMYLKINLTKTYKPFYGGSF